MNVQLSTLRTGRSGRIVRIDSPEVEVALLDLGVVIGDMFTLSDTAPLGDPIAISINGTKIFMRKKDAAAVWVESKLKAASSIL